MMYQSYLFYVVRDLDIPRMVGTWGGVGLWHLRGQRELWKPDVKTREPFHEEIKLS